MNLKWSPMEFELADFTWHKGYRLAVRPDGQWRIEQPVGHIIEKGKEKSEEQAKTKAVNSLQKIIAQSKTSHTSQDHTARLSNAGSPDDQLEKCKPLFLLQKKPSEKSESGPRLLLHLRLIDGQFVRVDRA